MLQTDGYAVAEETLPDAIGRITLGEIAAANMNKALVLKKFGLDFCCGGKQTLTEACNRKNLDAAAVYRALEATQPEFAGSPLRYREWTLSFLSDFIINTHHVYVRKALPDMVAYADKVARVHGDRHPELIEILQIVHSLDEEMTSHMFKEEQILFPYIKKLDGSEETAAHCFDTIASPIRMMEMEHEHAGGLLARAREITNQFTPPPEACGSYQLLFKLLEAFEEDLHVHVHLENNILFPKALSLEQSAAC
jgi:regulator of cell morphogenesis and NO signaling